MRNCSRGSLFCAVVAGILLGGDLLAQNASVQDRVTKAKASAYEPGHDLTLLYEFMCGPALAAKPPTLTGFVPLGGAQAAPPPAAAAAPGARAIPPRAQWYTTPTKVFDNLYYIGTQTDSAWVVSTSDGLVVVDTSYDYNLKETVGALKTWGLDPAHIKYIVLSHGHADRFAGARYLQDTFGGARVVVSEADWRLIQEGREPADAKPRTDLVAIATDGMKLTLGDTTLTLYLTSGHTPGGLTTIVPLRDGRQRHTGIVWPGLSARVAQHASGRTETPPEALRSHIAVLAKIRKLAATAGVDTYLTIHPQYDDALDKMRAVGFRNAGDPHPLVSRKNVERFFTVMEACSEAQLARVESGT